MRFQVPQHLDIKDSVLFGLSLKQIAYVAGPAGLFIFLLVISKSIIISLILSLPFMILGGALAFVQYNNREFIKVFYSLVRFMTRNKLYKYEKSSSVHEEVQMTQFKEKSSAVLNKNPIDLVEISTSLGFEKEE